MREKDIEARFWNKVAMRGPDDCWEWTAGKHSGGYGIFWFDGSMMPASRVAWSLMCGPVPAGLGVCHHCDNPACCNPSHLYPGTQKDNIRDCVERGRLGDRAGEANGNSKLKEMDIRFIRHWRVMGHRGTDIAKAFGVTPANIGMINRGVTWKEVGVHA